jgi:hypothetical protein
LKLDLEWDVKLRHRRGSATRLAVELAGADVDAAIPGLRAHLDGCPACREEHESLRALVSGEQTL